MNKLKSVEYKIFNKPQMDLVLAVVGSRSLKYYKNRVYFEINEIRKIHNVVAIVSGDCKTGVDAHAKEYAADHKILYTGYPAQWDDMKPPCIRKRNAHGEYNALAGINRNTTIVERCNAGIVLWDGKSTGSADVGNKLFRAGKLLKKIVISI